MPVDYSKWDALELSDDSDIEVHPNIDKRSFIRAKQNQIHSDREQRRNRIAALKYQRVVNEGLLSRVTGLLAALEARAPEAATETSTETSTDKEATDEEGTDKEAKAARTPAEIAFQAVMEAAGDPKDDQPPPRPEGIFSDASQPMPTYSRMLASLLDDVNKKLDEKKPEAGERFAAMVEEIRVHEGKIKALMAQEEEELEKLEKEGGKKITSESIHTGFDSSWVNKEKGKEKQQEQGHVELLNPNYSANEAGPSSKAGAGGDDNGEGKDGDDDEGEMEASPAGKKFAEIKANDYEASLQFIRQNPQILVERETDGLLMLAFDAALERKDELARQYVHQALLLQYCRALGRDGVALFFKRITTRGHRAQEMFFKDVQDTYLRIKNRSVEIITERGQDGSGDGDDGTAGGSGARGGGGVEQIQLHAMEPGTVINISVPKEGSEDAEEQAARRIFEGFAPEMRRALETGSLEEVNAVLGEMGVEEAEELVGLFGEANILSMEEKIIDATTEEGKRELREMEEAAAAKAAVEEVEEGEGEEGEQQEEAPGFTSDPE